jgi:hypothetical protein
VVILNVENETLLHFSPEKRNISDMNFTETQ